MQEKFLAIDIGASSGRHIVGWMESGNLRTEEVYRFPNSVQRVDGHLEWDIDSLFANVKQGIKVAFEQYPTIQSLSIDTWAVDYVLLKKEKPIYPVYAYRDSRTQAVLDEVHGLLPFEKLYACGAVGEMVADLERAGKRHAVITGVVEGGDPQVQAEIEDWCRAAQVRRRFRDTNLAQIGRPYPGMMDIRQIEQLSTENIPFQSLQFEIVNDEGETLYHSGQTARKLSAETLRGGSGVSRLERQKIYFEVDPYSQTNGTVYYTIDWWELFCRSSANTRNLLLVIVLLAIMSLALFWGSQKLIRQEVSRIQKGLVALGENQLDQRIEGGFLQAEFAQIAASINQMAASLKENIDKAYYYQLKHQQAEMQELQSKFNPHFLYNSLDLFRARCYENGDDETAELIAQTASIFRTFIGAKTFIPLQQELAFSQRYLAIYRARHSDAMQILYDIDKDVLEYGIIRNVFQPLIENYFAHGFDPSRHDNTLQFRGYLKDETHYVLTVEDNGFGMDAGQLADLNKKLREPIRTEQESYGLKNLHQRLQLYYGESCGLTLKANPEGGLIAELCVLRKRPEPETMEKA